MVDNWYVYVLISETTGRTYVGVAKDAHKRLQEHNGELPGGAKSTRGFRPWKLGRIYGPIPKSEAYRLEYQVKQKRGRERLMMTERHNFKKIGGGRGRASLDAPCADCGVLKRDHGGPVGTGKATSASPKPKKERKRKEKPVEVEEDDDEEDEPVSSDTRSEETKERIRSKLRTSARKMFRKNGCLCEEGSYFQDCGH